MVDEFLGAEFKERVLAALISIGREVEGVDRKLDALKDIEISNIKVEIAMLKVKSGLWGLVGGALGIAADIKIQGLSLQQQYDRAKSVPDFDNGGIGVYDTNFIHVDVRDGKARWSRINGVYSGLDQLVIP